MAKLFNRFFKEVDSLFYICALLAHVVAKLKSKISVVSFDDLDFSPEFNTLLD